MWFFALLACTDTPEVGPLADSGERIEVAKVSFNLWTDYIPMFGAVDSECRWLEPAIADDSTPWPPLQAFWVIYENENDVDVTQIDATYFTADAVLPQQFDPLDGLDALGFKYFSGFQQGLLDVEEIRRSDDGRTVEADFGSPISATIRLRATPTDSGCESTTAVCEAPCAEGFAPLSRIHLDLGAFFAVQDVSFEE